MTTLITIVFWLMSAAFLLLLLALFLAPFWPSLARWFEGRDSDFDPRRD